MTVSSGSPTIRGVAMIDPEKIKINSQSPPVVIEEIRIDGQSEVHRACNQLCRVEIELPPGKTRLDFFYTAPSFVAPEKVRFKYMLEGFDQDWVDSRHSPHRLLHESAPG